MAQKYNPREIEKRWQQRWAADHIYEVGEDSKRSKFYDLTMFPYTSGDLHIGHWYIMAPSDVYARFKRMQGYNVLHPMGFDAFGLPAENAAISRGIHPYKWTMRNIENMRRQLRSIGAIYDWNREVVTCLPDYYKWTQWFFLKFYHAGLAYRAEAPVNWCPRCQTVLANEQVVGEGFCERCNTPVTKRELEQWFFRITKYAEELLDHSHLDWPERIKIMQKNWVGRSEGAEIPFRLEHKGVGQKEIRVFTTRPDTIFGVTFFLLAPEHPLVSQLTTPEHKAEVDEYIAWCRRQTEYERVALGREKTGVLLGSYVVNPVSRERIPIWMAPIPIIYCDKCGIVPVPEEDLPVLLPPDAEFKPTGESPLKYCQSFVNTTCPKCSGPARRETDTMDTFMCSSWYFLRYTSPQTRDAPFDTDKMKYWLPVDLYTGGAEHAVMHLFYTRFFMKVLRDMGLVDFDEPFVRLFNQGTIVYRGGKMSKTRGNVIAPDEYVAELGADAVRGYLMFIGPWEMGGEWNDRGIVGISRWLNRVWSLVTTDYTSHIIDPEAEKEFLHLTHKTIKKVTVDLEKFRFNTMLASLMEFSNYLFKVKESGVVLDSLWGEAISYFLLLLAPSAPHLAEELWERTGQPYSIHNQPWPGYDEELAREEEITLVIQVNGKLRDKVLVPASISEVEAKELAMGRERVKAYIDGKKLTTVIYVPKRVVNIVVA